MFKSLTTRLALLSLASCATCFARGDVLIVADEFPAMEVLAAHLKTEEGIASRIVAQTNLPPTLAPFEAIIVYIHRDLTEPAERAFVDYAERGGKLIPLHHSISSGKRKNKQWFPFLGIDLPVGDVTQGGYKWIEPVTLDYFNLAPDHFIMTNRVAYPVVIRCRDPDRPSEVRPFPGFTLANTEVYLNHRFTGPRTILLGFQYRDTPTGTVYAQNRAGWIRPYGKGSIIYFQPGHSAADFEEATYRRILLNAVVYKP